MPVISIRRDARLAEVRWANGDYRFGNYCESPNGVFVLAWGGGNGWHVDDAGKKHQHRGWHVLTENDAVVTEGALGRPAEGRVANDGTHVLADIALEPKLRTILVVGRRDGTSIIRHTFSALAYKTGISAEGNYVACQVCNSDTSDSNTLSLFDVREGRKRWQLAPEPGWADQFGFDESQRRLSLIFDDGSQFEYDFEGAFADERAWIRSLIADGHGDRLGFVAKKRLEHYRAGPANRESLLEVLELLEAATSRVGDKAPYDVASPSRLAGELREELGDSALALKHYLHALAHNPKIGLKKRVANMIERGISVP
jgi:hypothetical protein